MLLFIIISIFIILTYLLFIISILLY